jgi:serine/threonine protein kinase
MQLAQSMLDPKGENVQLTAKYDMWRLGVMFYEIMAFRPYWHPDLKDSRILEMILNPTTPLPHEVKPVNIPEVQNVLEQLLHRDPDSRMDAKSLQKVLVTELATFVETTMNKATAKDTSTVVLST